MTPCRYILEIHKNIIENHITDDDFKEEVIKTYSGYVIYGISFGFVKYKSLVTNLTKNYEYIIRYKEFIE